MPPSHITAHFTWTEAACNCGCVMPVAVTEQVILTAKWAEEIRTYLGTPMRVLSWYRCAAWNKKVGGKAKSQHLTGRAIDFVQKTVSPRETQRLCKKLHPSHITGLGRYPGFTHVDRRDVAVEPW